MEVAFRWAREGIPSVRRKTKIGVGIMSAISSVSTADEVQWICNELSKRGFLRGYAMAHSEAQHIDGTMGALEKGRRIEWLREVASDKQEARDNDTNHLPLITITPVPPAECFSTSVAYPKA